MNNELDLDDATWPDAYLAIRVAAVAGRGTVERTAGDETLSWPKTTGDDVIAIAALLDPAIRQVATASDRPAFSKQWEATLAALAADAMNALGSTYTGSETFWSAVEDAVLHLDVTSADFPDPELLQGLVAQLAAPATRNAAPPDGPFKRFDNVHTYDELFAAQLVYLKDLRGYDRVPPEDATSAGDRVVPRSLNGDVIALADYWAPRFASVRHVSGHERVEAGWKAALADLNEIARKGDPNAVYPKNNAFWRALQRVAIQIAVAKELPTSTDLALAAIKESVVRLPETLKGAGASVVHAAEDAVKSAARGALTPVLIGAAAVTGLWLLFRNGSKNRAVE